MNFAIPVFFLLFGVVIVMGLFALFFGRRHQARWRQALSDTVLDALLTPRVLRLRRLKWGLSLAAMALLVVALAEPRTDRKMVSVQTEGIDLVVSLDLSLSMLAEDVKSSRLARARFEIQDLLKELVSDRVGLVLYAGSAIARLPLTMDHRVLTRVAGEAHPVDFQSQGSNLASALERSRDLLLNSSGAPTGKAVLVLSDGEVHNADAALKVAADLAQKGIVVYTMGIGEQESTIPTGKGPFQYKGKVVKTSPDFDVLEKVSNITGGAFVHSVAAPSDVNALVREMRSNLKAVRRDDQQSESWTSLFQYPLALGMFMLSLAWLLPTGVAVRPGLKDKPAPKPKPSWASVLGLLLTVLLLPSGADALAADKQSAQDAYSKGDYAVAVDEYTELSLASPDDPDLLDRLGAARYKNGDFEGASRAWDAASRLDPSSDSAFNAGNAYLQSGRLEEALKRYDDAIASNPDHPYASANRELVQQEMVARRQQQPPPPPPPPQEGEGEEENESEQNKDEQDPSDSESGEEGDESEDEPGEPEEGDPNSSGDPSESDSDDNPSEEQPSDPSEGEGQDGEPQDPSEQEPSTDPAGGGGIGEDTPAQDITEGQAHKLLDGIEEGQPQMEVDGASEELPW